LLAVSGGADSIALALAMWSHGLPVAVAHVMHDMRAQEQTISDRDFVESFSKERSLPFHWREIHARTRGGNLESASRTLRYRALVEIASTHGFRFIATAHHARDQAETLLMRLLRGAGTRGIGAMPHKRPLSKSYHITLIRPALEVHPDDLLAINREAGVAWKEDPTNQDTNLLRAKIRHELLPLLDRITPDSIAKLCSVADRCREDSAAIRALAVALESSGAREGDSLMFPRELLRAHPAAVIGAMLRSVAIRFDFSSADRVGSRVISPAVRAIRDRKQHERTFKIGALECHVNASRILIRPISIPNHE
jgi:tRNA(Ile)-lysidine synthase